MYDLFHWIIHRTARRLAIDLGWARRQFDSHLGEFRVLTYHGLVPDELADCPWVPSHYVSVSQFERQMAMLADIQPARPLSEVLLRTQVEEDTAPAICITFDDGMADNVTLALPILQQYGHAATFFLTTGLIGTPELLLNDVVRLLRESNVAISPDRISETCRRVQAEKDFGKSLSISKYASEMRALWAEHKQAVHPAALQSLRLMSWQQARELRSAGMEIGAHTVNHVILTRENRRTQRDEILQSIARIRSQLGQIDVPFAYPNGLPGDYDAFAVDILAALRVPYAVTERPGWNTADTPALELRRNCIGRHCSDQAFLAAVLGFDDSVLEDESLGFETEPESYASFNR